MASFETRGSAVRAVVRLPGGGKQTATFDTMREARAWAAVIEAQKTKEKCPDKHTNAELFETYLDAVASKTDTARWNRIRLMSLCKDSLASLRTDQTTTHDINAWINRRLTIPSEQTRRLLSPATVNRELNLLSGAFTYAVESLHWCDANPCHGAHRPEKPKPRKRPLLTPEEIEALCISTGYIQDAGLATKTAKVGAVFLLSLETGMRSGELLRLRPKDYHRKNRYIHVAAIDKGGRKGAQSGRAAVDPSRNVPLTNRAIELLDQLIKAMPEDQEAKDGFMHPPYIVGLDDRQRDALWRKARDQAGVEDLHFHDTKHEAATRLSKYIDVLALSHAIGTKDVRILRDTYYNSDASRVASLLPDKLTDTH